HDTRECKHLHEALLVSYNNGTAKIEPLKPRAKNPKNWSKNKEKKLLKQQSKSSRGDRENEEDKPDPGKDEKHNATTDEDQPHNRRHVQVIFSRQCISSDKKSRDEPKDLRGRLNLLRVKPAAPPTDNIDLRNRLKRK